MDFDIFELQEIYENLNQLLFNQDFNRFLTEFGDIVGDMAIRDLFERIAEIFDHLIEIMEETENPPEMEETGTPPELEPFKITNEQRENVRISNREIMLQSFADNINKQLPVNVKRITGTNIRNWLLSRSLIDGEIKQVVKKETVYNLHDELAEELGIRILEDTTNGTFSQKLKLSPQGQRYILNNIDGISDYITDGARPEITEGNCVDDPVIISREKLRSILIG